MLCILQKEKRKKKAANLSKLATSNTSLFLPKTAEQPLPSSVRKLNRPISPLKGKLSTLTQHEKEKPLLQGH